MGLRTSGRRQHFATFVAYAALNPRKLLAEPNKHSSLSKSYNLFEMLELGPIFKVCSGSK